MLKKFILLMAFLLLPLAAQAGKEIGLLIAQPDQKLDLAIIQRRVDWRTFEFEASGVPEEASYLWDFGDHDLGQGRQIKHQFPGSGGYKVTLSASDGAGGGGQIEKTVAVGFWHMNNLYVRIILGVLGLGIMVLAIGVGFNLFPKYEESE